MMIRLGLFESVLLQFERFCLSWRYYDSFNLVMLVGVFSTEQSVFPCYERFKVYIRLEPWKHPDMFT